MYLFKLETQCLRAWLNKFEKIIDTTHRVLIFAWWILDLWLNMLWRFVMLYQINATKQNVNSNDFPQWIVNQNNMYSWWIIHLTLPTNTFLWQYTQWISNITSNILTNDGNAGVGRMWMEKRTIHKQDWSFMKWRNNSSWLLMVLFLGVTDTLALATLIQGWNDYQQSHSAHYQQKCLVFSGMEVFGKWYTLCIKY